MEEIIIYKYQLECIIEALKITSNIHNSNKCVNHHDRIVIQAYEFAKNALNGKKEIDVNYIKGKFNKINKK